MYTADSYYKENNKSLLKFNLETELKKEKEFLKEVDSISLQQARIDLETAYKNFFQKRARFPKYKKKKFDKQSYRTLNINNSIRIENNFIKLPKLKLVKIKLHRQLPKDSKIKNVTISCYNKKYYVSILVQYEKEINKIVPKTFLGLDYSQKELYIDSENRKANYPHYYRNSESKLSKEQRKFSNMKNFSNNWYKQKDKISNIHEKISNQRKDFLHKLSYELSNNYDCVCVEDIDLRNMSQKLKLGKNLMDNGFGMFRVFLNYKLEDRGKWFIKIDKWFPSSKMCRHCGYINKELKLNDREWICECGVVIERDYNAAINIRDCGMKMID